jgi:hypothetical protein
MTTCIKCGQSINEVILINGLPYGTTCAENILGIKQFPSWFKGGDWDEAQKQQNESQLKNAIEKDRVENITRGCWSEWVALSKISHKSYSMGNNFMIDFTESIINRLGYWGSISSSLCKYNTMDEAKINHKEWMGTFPQMYRVPMTIDSLSDKQLNILNKYL